MGIRYSPGTSVGQSVTISPRDNCERTPDEVTWCMNVWHPTELIEVCMNHTWSLSSPLAAQLNLSDHLEYVLESSSSCPKTGCLKVKDVQVYFLDALFTSTVQVPNCSAQFVNILSVAGTYVLYF